MTFGTLLVSILPIQSFSPAFDLHRSVGGIKVEIDAIVRLGPGQTRKRQAYKGAGNLSSAHLVLPRGRWKFLAFVEYEWCDVFSCEPLTAQTQ